MEMTDTPHHFSVNGNMMDNSSNSGVLVNNAGHDNRFYFYSLPVSKIEALLTAVEDLTNQVKELQKQVIRLSAGE